MLFQLPAIKKFVGVTPESNFKLQTKLCKNQSRNQSLLYSGFVSTKIPLYSEFLKPETTVGLNNFSLMRKSTLNKCQGFN